MNSDRPCSTKPFDSVVARIFVLPSFAFVLLDADALLPAAHAVRASEGDA